MIVEMILEALKKRTINVWFFNENTFKSEKTKQKSTCSPFTVTFLQLTLPPSDAE